MKLLLVLIIIGIFCVVLGALLWYASRRKGGKTLTITKDGATLTTGSTFDFGLTGEGYMKMPRSIRPCHTGEPHDITDTEWCDKIGYDKDKHGMTYFYDLGFGGTKDIRFKEECVVKGDLQKCTEVVACSGDGFGCAFTEEFDANGALIGITNSEGLQLLDVMANDAWDGKWEDWDVLNKEIKKLLEWKDGKLVLTRDFRLGTAGTELTLPMAIQGGMPPTLYFIALLGSMKIANEKKPGEIKLQVDGAKDVFIKTQFHNTVEGTK